MKGTFLKAPEESNIVDIHLIGIFNKTINSPDWTQIGEKNTNIQFLRTGKLYSLNSKEFVNPKNRIIGKFRIPNDEDQEALFQTFSFIFKTFLVKLIKI
jgi:arginine/ornithine N-succinyltransferase beta subunit